MKVLFVCFSGTGNTRRVCETLQGELESAGHEAKIISIHAGKAQLKDEEFDILVVGYPVHAFNAPKPALDFLKSLPKWEGEKPCYLVRVSGEPLSMNHAAGILPKRILRRRGFRVMGEFHYVMPYNIIFRHSDGMAARMDLAMKRRAKEDALFICQGKGKVYHNGPVRRAVSFVLRIEHPAMKRIGRHFRVSEDCVGCGLCETVCPQGNIKIADGRPVFGKNCAGCMGCSFQCPKDALKLGILNGWRVNGKYSFDVPPAKDAEICRYCRKSYLKYFHISESESR